MSSSAKARANATSAPSAQHDVAMPHTPPAEAVMTHTDASLPLASYEEEPVASTSQLPPVPPEQERLSAPTDLSGDADNGGRHMMPSSSTEQQKPWALAEFGIPRPPTHIAPDPTVEVGPHLHSRRSHAKS